MILEHLIDSYSISTDPRKRIRWFVLGHREPYKGIGASGALPVDLPVSPLITHHLIINHHWGKILLGHLVIHSHPLISFTSTHD